MFFNYKNTMTDNTYIGIAPDDMGIHFSSIYPGSVSDSDITEKTNILDYVNHEKKIMSDRGFAIQDLCTEKSNLFESS